MTFPKLGARGLTFTHKPPGVGIPPPIGRVFRVPRWLPKPRLSVPIRKTSPDSLPFMEGKGRALGQD